MFLTYDDAALRNALRFAYAVATNSPDPSTQNGAVIYDARDQLLGIGWNDFTRGIVPTPDLFERPKKYDFIEHAERNALFDCFGREFPPDGGTLVCTWKSCADCSRAIIESGIKRLIYDARHDPVAHSGSWGTNMDHGEQMMHAAGIEIITIKDDLGGCDPVLFDGELWTP